jgi:hypothetical protein
MYKQRHMSSRILEGCRTPDARRCTCRGRHGAEDRCAVKLRSMCQARARWATIDALLPPVQVGPKVLAWRCVELCAHDSSTPVYVGGLIAKVSEYTQTHDPVALLQTLEQKLHFYSGLMACKRQGAEDM